MLHLGQCFRPSVRLMETSYRVPGPCQMPTQNVSRAKEVTSQADRHRPDYVSKQLMRHQQRVVGRVENLETRARGAMEALSTSSKLVASHLVFLPLILWLDSLSDLVGVNNISIISHGASRPVQCQVLPSLRAMCPYFCFTFFFPHPYELSFQLYSLLASFKFSCI